MNILALHAWQVSPEEALRIQRELAARVVRQDLVREPVRAIAGVDLSPEDADGWAQGAAVLVSYPELQVMEVSLARARVTFPYIPGLLSFRESPPLLAALEKLRQTPDLLLVDGQGIAHPRRFGIACHLGLLTDLPAIGCAKSILRGRHGPLGHEAGSTADLVDKGETVGAAVRSRTGVSPLYVSIGHKVDLPSAVRWTLACCQGQRLPVPTRYAHEAAAGRLKPPPADQGPLARQERLL